MKQEDSGKPQILMSWKEIASYLAVDERTCARWEKRFFMPVHRPADATARSRVFAYTNELDRWLETTFPRSQEEKLPRIEREKRRSTFKQSLWIPTSLAIALIAIILLRSVMLGRLKVNQTDMQPTDFHIHGSNLIVVNENDKELWRQELPFEGLFPES